MPGSQSHQSPALTESKDFISDSAAKPLAAALALLTLMIFFAAAMPSPIRAAWDRFSLRIQLQTQSLPLSPARLSDEEIAEISEMAPQDQAERLLQRAISHSDGALDLITKFVDSWYGQLELQSKLSSLLMTALNSDDMRVRSAALESELAAYNLPKRPQSAQALIRRIHDEPAARPWALWMLGVLGNRGVEPQKAFAILMDHRHDSQEQIRYWTIEGLSMLGTDQTIAPLLETLRSDPSPLVRERASCALAQSGMLTKEQRLRAVPDLLKMTDDATLDSATRGWIFQALHDITGASVPSQPDAWRTWWALNGHS